MPTISKEPAPITASQTTSEAFATILRHNFDYAVQWEETARTPEHIEGVHQIRVSFRRMRSALSLFRGAIPKAASSHWNQEMRWLAGQLGLARDLDVFISEGLTNIAGKLPLEGEGRLIELAEQHRARAYREEVCAMLDSGRYSRFKQGFVEWLDNRAWEQAELKKKNRKCLKMKLLLFSRLLMDKQERRVLKSGSHVDKNSPEAMHRLRIECKKLRYAAEFFSPLFQGMDLFISHMKGLQDLLGVMHDVAVMHHLLEILLADEKDQQAEEYAGGIVGWKTCEFHHLLESFEPRWEEFSEASHPWWKKGNSNDSGKAG